MNNTLPPGHSQLQISVTLRHRKQVNDTTVVTFNSEPSEAALARYLEWTQVIAAKTCQPDIRWRDVKAEMPDADETVLVFHPREDEPVWFGYFDGDEWRDVNGETRPVTHWAPMPEPPKHPGR